MELSPKRKNILVAVLALGTFSITNTEMGIMGILPLISRQFQVNIATAGEMVSYFALIISISGPFLPALLARFDKKKVMLLAVGLFVVSCFASVFITDFNLLLIVRLIPAFLHPVFVSYAMAIATKIAANQAEASQLISKVFMGVSAGMVLGVPVANAIASYGSFQWVMLIFGLINATIWIACAIFLIPVKEASPITFKEQMHVLFQVPTLIGIMIIVCLNGAVFGFYSYLSNFLSKASLASSWLISILLLVYGLTNVLGNEIAGKLLAKIPQKVLIGLPWAMILPYLILYLAHKNLIIVFVLIFILGVFAGIEANLNQYVMNEALRETPELANGLFITGANLGTTVGSMICGQFITHWGVNSSLLATIMFLVIGIVIIFINWEKYYKSSN